LTALICYIQWRLSHRWLYYIAVLFAAFLGMLSKELTLTLPVMLFVIHVFFFRRSKENLFPRDIFPFFLVACIIPAVMMIERANSVLFLKDQVVYASLKWENVLTEMNVLRTYLRLLFFPLHQNLDYDYPRVVSFWQADVWLSIGILAMMIFGVVRSYSKNRLFSFCILWFFISVSVESVQALSLVVT
jgi:protein O-mannosyl-transferase